MPLSPLYGSLEPKPKPEVKYSKPKILLMDVFGNSVDVLAEHGYNTEVGSFGGVLTILRQAGRHIVPPSHRIPSDLSDMDVFIVETDASASESSNASLLNVGDGVSTWWQSAVDGCIDSRPVAAQDHLGELVRARDYGAIFVFFLGPPRSYDYCFGSTVSGRVHGAEYTLSPNSIVEQLVPSLMISCGSGKEVTPASTIPNLSQTLAKGMRGVHYECSLGWSDDSTMAQWAPLMLNKHGDCVGGACLGDDGKPWLLALPQMPSFGDIVVELVEQHFVDWRPKLFPFHAASQWVHWPEYELPAVLEKQAKIGELKEEVAQRVAGLETEIESIRQERADEYMLLQGTGDELVVAVINALHQLGFTDVRDMDTEADANNAQRREDIQIHDCRLTLIVDVKGVNGHPEDAESTQAAKHATTRMREWGRVDVQGLTIINHQKNMPPHERDQRAYRKEIIGNAEDDELGLMTTWDLFRLLRNKEKNGWPVEAVKPIFYRTGRIDPIPEHYTEIGTIVKKWKGAFGVRPSQPIAVGQSLAVAVGDGFEEIEATSLQIDGREVDTAPVGSDCGVACPGASGRFREGTKVYLIGLPAGGSR